MEAISNEKTAYRQSSFRISDRWGWVTSHGMFTDDRNLAYVGIHYTSPNIGPCFCGGGGLGENTVW